MHIDEKKGIQYRSKVARKMHRTIDRNLSIKINCAMAEAAAAVAAVAAAAAAAAA